MIGHDRSRYSTVLHSRIALQVSSFDPGYSKRGSACATKPWLLTDLSISLSKAELHVVEIKAFTYRLINTGGNEHKNPKSVMIAMYVESSTASIEQAYILSVHRLFGVLYCLPRTLTAGFKK